MSNQNQGEVQKKIMALQDKTAKASMRFACSMMHSMNEVCPEQNVIFSPISIYSTLALIHFGAINNTRKEIAQVMGVPQDTESRELLEILSEILLDINVVMETAGRSTYSINVQNQIFVQSDIILNPFYVSYIPSVCECEISSVDFESEPERTKHIINDFISRTLNADISDGISEYLSESMDRWTRLVFVSCMNLKLIWNDGFHCRSTRSAKFHTENGDVDVQMMRYKTYEKLPYVDLPNLHFEAVELSFKGKHESIYIILPKQEKSLNDIISSLNDGIVRQIINKVVPLYVDLNLPKMNLACTGNLYKALLSLGINDAFNDRAQLSNISTNPSLQVSKIIHAVEVEFGEEKVGALTKVVEVFSKCLNFFGTLFTGSVASGVMGSISSSSSSLVNPVWFDVNRPFLFFIYHHVSKSILFFGAIRDPSAS